MVNLMRSRDHRTVNVLMANSRMLQAMYGCESRVHTAAVTRVVDARHGFLVRVRSPCYPRSCSLTLVTCALFSVTALLLFFHLSFFYSLL